jgi:hypothetical protein
MSNIPNVGYLSGNESMAEVIDHVAKLQKMVEFLATGNISSVNAREFGGWLVGTTALQARAGDVGMSTANDSEDPVRLWAGSVDKDTAPWRVYKSGKGVATGWKFQATEGSYPNIVFDPETLLMAAYQDALNYVFISPSFDGAPVLGFTVDGNTVAQFYASPDGVNIASNSKDLTIATGISGNIYISAELGYSIFFPRGFDTVYGANGENLGAMLYSMATKDVNTSSAGGHNHGIPDGTQLMTASGGTVTWSAAGGHTHTQK